MKTFISHLSFLLSKNALFGHKETRKAYLKNFRFIKYLFE